MFLLSLLTNKDSYNTQISQCVNDTIFRKRFQVPGFGTGSGTLEPVPWNRFLRQITTKMVKNAAILAKIQVQYESGQGELYFGLDILPKSTTVAVSALVQ